MQLEKINNEKLMLEQRLQDLNEEAATQKDIAAHIRSAKQLLLSLKDKLKDGEPSFEVKREIIKILVKEVRIKTKKPEDDLRHPRAIVSITYRLEVSSKDVLHTDMSSVLQSMQI